MASARFDQLPASAHVVLELEMDDGKVVRQELQLDELPREALADRLSTVARVAAAVRLAQQDESVARSTALRYRLVSPWTNWFVVAKREAGEKAEGLPELRKVPQTLAAGWGGMGTVAGSSLAIMCCVSADNAASASFDWAGELADASVGERVEMQLEPRLLRLANAYPARLRVSGALGFLEEAGLADRFPDVFELASALGIESDVIAEIILVGYLDHLVSRAGSDEARDAMPALQQEARSAFAASERMARSVAALQRALGEAVKCEVLESGRTWKVEEGARPAREGQGARRALAAGVPQRGFGAEGTAFAAAGPGEKGAIGLREPVEGESEFKLVNQVRFRRPRIRRLARMPGSRHEPLVGDARRLEALVLPTAADRRSKNSFT